MKKPIAIVKALETRLYSPGRRHTICSVVRFLIITNDQLLMTSPK